MDCSPTNLTHFRSDVLNQTYLGQICGSQQLFHDRYEIRKLLGRGGFGVTFLARDRGLPGSPLCVIKQLCPKVQDATALQKARQRFEQEAKSLGRLGSHSQIPQLLNYFETNGDFYLIQEYVRGSTLTKEVRRLGTFSEEKVKAFLQELLPLLRYVHKNRVIHRDIKPPNLLRCKDDGRLVLIDFGAVKERIAIVDHSGIRTSTQFVGTIGFAPPEQLSLRPVYASDLYAVGVTCLYLLTGKAPIEFEYDLRTGEIKWRDLVRVSDHFGRVLDKMLRASPCDRYQSAEEVLRTLALEPYLDHLLPCMSNHPLSVSAISPSRSSRSREVISPLVRTAIAIRDWQARLQERRTIQDTSPLLSDDSFTG